MSLQRGTSTQVSRAVHKFELSYTCHRTAHALTPRAEYLSSKNRSAATPGNIHAHLQVWVYVHMSRHLFTHTHPVRQVREQRQQHSWRQHARLRAQHRFRGRLVQQPL
eukprot:1161772-Pelagomonas_calceolata.AAC.9